MACFDIPTIQLYFCNGFSVKGRSDYNVVDVILCCIVTTLCSEPYITFPNHHIDMDKGTPFITWSLDVALWFKYNTFIFIIMFLFQINEAGFWHVKYKESLLFKKKKKA